MTLGDRLRAWRKTHRLTQTAAAKAAGISQSAWSELETDDVERIGLDVAERVVKVTSGAVTLQHFPRPRGKRVRPIEPESGTSVTTDEAKAS